jgi:GNAT superfamily N-acetyltransferase
MERLLKFLYEDEILNNHLIYQIESGAYQGGDLLINGDPITSVLYCKDDGNSYFVSFAVKEGHEDEIAKELLVRKRDDLLLSGRRETVEKILALMGLDKIVYPDVFYLHNGQKTERAMKQRLAQEEDRLLVEDFMIQFFEAKTEQSIKRIKEKLTIKSLYLFGEDSIKGMIRYVSSSDHYINLTAFYVPEEERGKGYGKSIMNTVIADCLEKGKYPILQTGVDNINARRLYEALGFEYYCDYTFTFIFKG